MHGIVLSVDKVRVVELLHVLHLPLLDLRGWDPPRLHLGPRLPKALEGPSLVKLVVVTPRQVRNILKHYLPVLIVSLLLTVCLILYLLVVLDYLQTIPADTHPVVISQLRQSDKVVWTFLADSLTIKYDEMREWDVLLCRIFCSDAAFREHRIRLHRWNRSLPLDRPIGVVKSS